MSDPDSTKRPYRVQYETAARKFDDGKMEECIAAAKYNLMDPTLPLYYVTMNCILVASALDNWEDADVWRLSAEQAYITSFYDATQKQDEALLKALQDLRAMLDELNTFRKEDMEGEDEPDSEDGMGVSEIEDGFDIEDAAKLEDEYEPTGTRSNLAEDNPDTKAQVPTDDTVVGTDNPTISCTAKGKLQH